MRKVFYLALVGIAAWALTACEPNDPDAKYPKKNLIEEFTGQTCGYCPYGMDCIHNFIGNDSNWILILHHDGYEADHFTVSGSKTITKALGVNVAPNMSINRATTNYGGRRGVVFHPGYLEKTNTSQFATTTYATIELTNTYDTASRELQVRVEGNVAKKKHPQLHLTVVIKESGMIDTQSDYYHSYEGWQEFRHANAVRAFLTEAKGDEISVKNGKYAANYFIKLNTKWIPENCMVVAFLSEEFKPVVQAEQAPVVEGTLGGADIQHEGITRVPVADYYPEPNATNGPATYSGLEADTLTNNSVFYEKYPAYGVIYWYLQTYNPDATLKVGSTTCAPFAQIYFYTDIDASTTTVPTGRFPLSNSDEAGTAEAGYRDDDLFEIGGCQFYYVSKAYLNQGYLLPSVQWLIADGELTIEEDGWSLTGHTRNGADINLVGKGAIQIAGKMNAPAQAPRRSHTKKQILEYCK